MEVTASPSSGFALASLARWAAAQPSAAEASGLTSLSARPPDAVVFSSITPLGLLSDLASTGLRQLLSLLPIVERALLPEASPAPLGHLAKALGAAARQIDDGHGALLTGNTAAPAPSSGREALRAAAREIGLAADPLAHEPAAHEPAQRGQEIRQALRATARQLGNNGDPAALLDLDRPATAVERWLAESKQALRDATGALTRAEHHLHAAEPTAASAADTAWALGQVSLAQLQVASALQAVTTSRLGRPAAPTALAGQVQIGRLGSAVALFGVVLLVVLLCLAAGSWLIVTGVAGLIVTAAWVWRLSRLRLEPRR